MYKVFGRHSTLHAFQVRITFQQQKKIPYIALCTLMALRIPEQSQTLLAEAIKPIGSTQRNAMYQRIIQKVTIMR